MLKQLDVFHDDMRAAVRSLMHAPGFSFAVLATLAVGVGGNLATLSVVDRLLFRPPPGIRDAENVRRIYVREQSPGGSPRVYSSFSLNQVRELSEIARGAATIATYSSRSNVPLGDSALRVKAAYVGNEYFQLFGLRPQLGRFFVHEEMSGGSSPGAVISEALWARVFGRSPDVIGRVTQLAGAPVTIVGVIDGPFQEIELEPTDVWMPLAAKPVGEAGPNGAIWVGILARLAPKADERSLAERLTTQYRRMRKMDRYADPRAVISLAPLAKARAEEMIPMDVRNVGLTKRLAGVAIAVLVVSIGNVLVLFLVRAIRRRRELAVRVALGASRLRIAVQLLLEGMLLGASGAAVAVLAGVWSGSLLGSWLLPPMAVGPIVDRHAIVLAALVAVAIGSIAGLAPVLIGPRIDGGQALRLDSSSGDKRGTKLRMGFLATQVALCVALITVAATFQQSLLRLARTNLGVDRERMITVMVSGQQLREGAIREALMRIQRLPGVIAAASASNDLSGLVGIGRFAIAGRFDVASDAAVAYSFVDTAYFRAAGIPLLAGRGLEPGDFVEPAAVAVISRSMAQTYWSGRNPFGDCFYALRDKSRCVRVIGVVDDIRWDLSAPPQPQYYMPLGRFGVREGNNLIVRTRDRATSAMVTEIDRIATATIGNSARKPIVARVADRLDRQIRPWKAAATLFLLFGFLALIASAAGVYATVSYEVAQRRTELAVRLTLGATLLHLMQTVVGSVGRACAIGAVVGLGLALAGGRVIAAFLFDTPANNVTALFLAVATVAGAAIVATLAPAWKVTRLNLASVLRT